MQNKAIKFRVTEEIYSDLESKSEDTVSKHCKQIIINENNKITFPNMVLISKKILTLFFDTMRDETVSLYLAAEHQIFREYTQKYLKKICDGNIKESLEVLFSYIQFSYGDEIKLDSTATEMRYTWSHKIGKNFSAIYSEVLKVFLHDDMQINADVYGNETEIIIIIKNQ